MHFNEAPSRRDVLRAMALGAIALPSAGTLLSACSSDARPAGRPTTTGARIGSPTTAAFDPERPWWLQQGFAPVTTELTTAKLEVAGTIPTTLTGLYVRNGSNPSQADSSHWFFGDGMLHGVRLNAGKAEWYRNRYVQTPLYKQRVGFGGSGVPGGQSSQSNVSVIWHANKLLSSGEVGFPFAINPQDLSTVGIHDFGGKLKSSFTAHPKIDPRTGYLHSFGYGFTEPFLTYNVADAAGTLISSESVKVAGPTMNIN